VLLNLGFSSESHRSHDPSQSKCVFLLPSEILLPIFLQFSIRENVSFVFTIFCKFKTVIW